VKSTHDRFLPTYLFPPSLPPRLSLSYPSHRCGTLAPISLLHGLFSEYTYARAYKASLPLMAENVSTSSRTRAQPQPRVPRTRLSSP
jgi:hypothetical protein